MRDASIATRRSRALAFWGAAQTELMLETAGDSLWTVGVPRLIDSLQTTEGQQLRWAIHLTAPPGARVALAMKALRDVVATFGDQASG